MKTGTLTKRKQYEFNPHRHIKIWLSKNPRVFMNELNQLRLVRMRVDCPNDEINLIYDSQLLSKDTRLALLTFCTKHDVTAVDIRNIVSQCNQDSEQQLIKIYEDEISHLDAGGNLAAASDILRWLEPIYRLGTYSDFDVTVSTKDLPKTIPVFAELLLNLGSTFSKDKNPCEEEYPILSNDVIAVLNPRSARIKKIHQYIISACAPGFTASRMVGYLPDSFHGEAKQYNHYLTKLRGTYFGKTPREWRANIPDFIQCLSELIKQAEKSDFDFDAQGFSKLLELWNECSGNGDRLQQKLYMDSVIETTGPSLVANLFPRIISEASNNFFSAYSLSFYKPIFRAFYSSQACSLHMSRKDYENRARTNDLSCDLSWLELGLSRITDLEKKLHHSAAKIQKKWVSRITALEMRVKTNHLHRMIKDRAMNNIPNRGDVAATSLPRTQTSVIELDDKTVHELHQPLTAYFETPQGLVVLDYLVKNKPLEILLTPFLEGEYFTQESDYVKELIRDILKSIDCHLEKYTSTQLVDMTRILRPYGVDDRLEKVEKLTQYQKGMLTRDDDIVQYCIVTSLPFPPDSCVTPDDIIEYHRQNRTICIDCLDFYFNALECLSHKKLIVELAQTHTSEKITKRGNIYAIYRYVEILKTLPGSELSAVLTRKNKVGKTISDYLLEERDKQNLAYEYILISYVDILRKISPSLRPRVLSSDKNFTLVARIMYESRGNPEILCAYLVLFGNDKKLFPHGYYDPIPQQLVFEYIQNMANSSYKHKLIDLALSADSALNAFITYIPDNRINFFLIYPSLQYFHPYIWALSELKSPPEQQSNALFSATMRFFLPTPLNVTKIEKSEFDYGR